MLDSSGDSGRGASNILTSTPQRPDSSRRASKFHMQQDGEAEEIESKLGDFDGSINSVCNDSTSPGKFEESDIYDFNINSSVIVSPMLASPGTSKPANNNGSPDMFDTQSSL